jgi:hypothetical protein
MSTEDDAPDPARLAAIDQQLAELSDRLDRHARAIMRSDLITVVVAVVLIAVVLIARPPLYRWELVAALAAIALGAAGGFIQGLMLRSYRAEIRELRARR